MLELVNQTIKSIEEKDILSMADIEKARRFSEENNHVILSQGKEKITLLLNNVEDVLVQIHLEDDFLHSKIDNKTIDWDVNGLTALYIIADEFEEESLSEGIKYTKEGMIKRVMEERYDKAKKAEYKVRLSKNLYGEHTLINEKGKTYKITLRDFENKTGYINNIDWRTNKLGTTKHIMYLFDYLEQNPSKTKKMDKIYPFIEIFTDPMNDYRITWSIRGHWKRRNRHC